MEKETSEYIVIDTDVISFLFKKDSRAELYRSYIKNKIGIVSFMTVAELDRWAIEHQWGDGRKENLEKYLKNFLVYPFDRNLCRKWAEITSSCSLKGKSIACADAWIAATAMLYQIPLITHNTRHYMDIDGLEIITESDK